MLTEAETIPYEPAPLRGERLLVLAPHPDDEVIGCGGLVALHLAERRAVRIVIATDGAEAGDAATREEESRRGISRLGDGAGVEFLRRPDRALDGSVAAIVRNEILSFRPDLVLVPSPVEIHPDHLALSRVFCELVQEDEALSVELSVTRVAFYEISCPLRPNALVDISAVADAKYAAIGEHRSQLELRDYVAFARGLNAFRAMTLPPGTRAAEAYFVLPASELRTTAMSRLRQSVGGPPSLEITTEAPGVSVVVRTKERPALLREALDSIAATGYPCETVVVNDGGGAAAVDEVAGSAKVIHHARSLGRSEAANAGVRAASKEFVCFLDDDDLFYPEHLSTLTAAARLSGHAGWYTDAVSAFLRPSADGTYETHSRLRIYASDFDREMLLVDNYVPLPALLVSKERFLEAGGFDPAFDLFEDWDFLIRLTSRGSLLRIPRVTCEIRHFEGGSSVILSSPEGSERFRSAKLQVWKKHEASIGPAVIASAVEKQKKRLGELTSRYAEAKGSLSWTQGETARLEREKQQLIGQAAATQDLVNGYAFRVRELEATIATLAPLAARLEEKAVELERTRREVERLRSREQELGRTYVEIDRLNGLLGMIYRSRTWKLHNLLQKLRGRG